MIKKILNKLTSQSLIFVFAVLFLIHCFLNFTFITANSVFLTNTSYFFAAVGMVLAVLGLIAKQPWRMESNKSKFSIRNIFIMLFIISMIITTIIMKQYNFTDNIKATIWMILDLVVLVMLTKQETDDKWLRRFTFIFVVLVGVYAFLSCLMAFVGYFYDPYGLQGDTTAGGLALGRLYGMYADPNYGAPISGLAIVSMFYLWNKGHVKNWVLRILFIVFAFLELIYVGISGSRTAILSTCIMLFIGVLILVIYHLMIKRKYNNWKRLVIGIGLSTVVCCLFCVGVFGLSSFYEKLEPSITANIGGPVSNVKTTYPSVFSELVAEKNNMVPDQTIQDSASEKLLPEIQKSDTPSNEASRGTENFNQPNKPESQNLNGEGHIGFLGREDYGDISNGRFSIWKSCIELSLTRPFFGLSNRGFLAYAKQCYPDSYLAKTAWSSMHNNFFEVLISQGLIGLFLYIAIFVCFGWNIVVGFRHSWKLKDTDKVKDYWYFTALFVGSIVISLFLAELVYVVTILSTFFWYSIGHIPECYRLKEVKHEP